MQGVSAVAGALGSAALDVTGVTAVASGALEAYRAGRAELSRRLRPRTSTAQHLEEQRVGREARERERGERREAARTERIDRRMRDIEAREEAPQGGATTSFFGGVAEAFSAAVSDVAQRAAALQLPAIQLPTYVPPRSSLLERVPGQAAAAPAPRRAGVAAQPAPAPVAALLEAEAPSAVAPAGDFADGFPAAPAAPESEFPRVPARDAETRMIHLNMPSAPRRDPVDRMLRLPLPDVPLHPPSRTRQLAAPPAAYDMHDRLDRLFMSPEEQGLMDRARALGPVNQRLRQEPYRRAAAERATRRMEQNVVFQERQAVRNALASGAVQPVVREPEHIETHDEYVARMRPAFPRAVDPYVDTSFDSSALAARLAALSNPGPSRAERNLQAAIERAREERAQREAT